MRKQDRNIVTFIYVLEKKDQDRRLAIADLVIIIDQIEK